MRINIKKLFIFFTLIFALCSSMIHVNATSSTIETVTVNVKYGQSEARSMLSLINKFRTGSDAWYWNETNTTKIKCSGLNKLQYDYQLEKVAMQRAAEIALSFSHTRPDNTLCYSAYSDYEYVYMAAGENIAAGYSSAKLVFEGWQETNCNYIGQGHRRNMLSSSYNAIGIGHVYFNGYHYWVQEFGSNVSSASKTTANDSSTNVNVSVNSDLISSKTIKANKTSLEVVKNQTLSLPSVNITFNMLETWPSSSITGTVKAKWTITDNTIAKIENNKIVGLKVGNTTLKTTVYGKTLTVNLTVSSHAHKWKTGVISKKATFSANGTISKVCTLCNKTVTTSTISKVSTVKLSKTSYVYNGKVQTPSLTIKDSSGKTLKKGTDYTVSYSSGRKNVGKYTIKVTLKGKYNGTKTLTYKIVPKSTSISKLTAKSKGFTIKWKKQTTQTIGYQIQYSTSSAFKSGNKTVNITSNKTTSKTISKLTKNKKYYVRIRTYKKVGSTYYYSSWSSIKNIKTK